MTHRAKFLERFTAYALAGRIRRNQFWKSLFQIDKLMIKAVVLAVGYIWPGFDVVRVIVAANFSNQLRMAFLGIRLSHPEIFNAKKPRSKGRKNASFQIPL